MDINKSKKIINILKNKKLKISFAESCTGGMLTSSITSIKGSSKVFEMGLVTYSNQAKKNILKVPAQIIRKNGAVSMHCCLSMVNNLRKISRCKICVSITGIAGPSGGTKHKPVGLVFIGIMNAIGTLWIFMLMLLISADVLGRELLGTPIRGVTEIISLSIVAIVFLQLAFHFLLESQILFQLDYRLKHVRILVFLNLS